MYLSQRHLSQKCIWRRRHHCHRMWWGAGLPSPAPPAWILLPRKDRNDGASTDTCLLPNCPTSRQTKCMGTSQMRTIPSQPHRGGKGIMSRRGDTVSLSSRYASVSILSPICRLCLQSQIRIFRPQIQRRHRQIQIVSKVSPMSPTEGDGINRGTGRPRTPSSLRYSQRWL